MRALNLIFIPQVKDLLNPASESILEPVLINFELIGNFAPILKEISYTNKFAIAKLADRHRLGKTVSNARKYELITALS